jgi:hypothetical protein
MTLQPGARLGPYEVRGAIGAGGMGQVYRAHDTRLGRDVALKTLPPAFAADRERVARFEREARILAVLNHPNIATIHGVEEQDGTVALVMELVNGETLQELLRRRTSDGRGLARPTALAIARQIVDALDAAHEKGVVHRDLKPANIKITPDDVVKVLDFGLAKSVPTSGADADQSPTRSLAADDTRDGVVMGTVAYMSPEQARGQPVDRRTDIWAFGCVLVEILTGRKAFSRATASDTIAAILGAGTDQIAIPDSVPPHLRRLIGRCLEKDVKLRLRDIGDARSDLVDAQLEAAVPASTGVSRRRWLTGGAAALGLLGAGFGGGAIVAGRRGSAPTPSYRRLTFRRGLIRTARFAPDFQTILYGALWDGDVCRVYTVRPDSPESSPLNLPAATPLAVSHTGELALALGSHLRGIMTYGTLARVPLAGGAPRELMTDVKYADWSPDGRDLAVVRRTGGREQLEFPAGTVIAEPRVPGGGFSFPRVSPGGDAVAVFELGQAAGLSGRVAIVDRAGAKKISSANYVNVFGLAWKGDEVWFTAADELPLFRNAVCALRPDGDVRIVARVPGNASLHDVAPDGRALIARTDDRSGISVLAPGAVGERDLSWLDAPTIADISPDGRQILFSEIGVGGGPRLSSYLRGTDGSPAVRLGDGRAVALSLDGRWALVRTGSPHLDLVPTGAGQARRLAPPGLTLLAARWLDDRRIVVRAQAGDRVARLYVLDVESNTVRAVTPDGVTVAGTAWALAPDRSMVAVSSAGRIDLYPTDGGPPRQARIDPGPSRFVGWIEGGLLVAENPQAAGPVFRVDPTTGRRELWRDIQPRDPTGIMNLTLSSLVVTPDGRAYGYTWHRAISDLYLVEGWG